MHTSDLTKSEDRVAWVRLYFTLMRWYTNVVQQYGRRVVINAMMFKIWYLFSYTSLIIGLKRLLSVRPGEYERKINLHANPSYVF